jgi:hypothetical protein
MHIIISQRQATRPHPPPPGSYRLPATIIGRSGPVGAAAVSAGQRFLKSRVSERRRTNTPITEHVGSFGDQRLVT